MMQNNMSEAAMLRDILKQKEARIAELENKIKVLEDKHWEECRQIAHYDNDLQMVSRVIDAIAEGVL